MRTRIRFFLDEHLAQAITEALHRRGIQAVSVADVGRRGLSDAEQLEWAAEQGLVMVSRDSDFISLHTEKPTHAGIVHIPRTADLRAVIRGLLLIHEVLDAGEMTDKLEYLPQFNG